MFADIQKHVVDAGKAAGAGDQIGTVLYNRGVYAACLAAEAAKDGSSCKRYEGHQRQRMMRDGMEALKITEGSMAALDCQALALSSKCLVKTTVARWLAGYTQWDAAAQRAGLWSPTLRHPTWTLLSR